MMPAGPPPMMQQVVASELAVAGIRGLRVTIAGNSVKGAAIICAKRARFDGILFFPENRYARTQFRFGRCLRLHLEWVSGVGTVGFVTLER